MAKAPEGQRRPAPRLYLATPPLADANALKALLAEAFQGGDIAAILLRLAPADERTLINRVKAIAPSVQERGVALLLDGHIDIAMRAGADGVHVRVAELQAAISSLKPERIVGVGGLTTRHDAMVAGEAGADYVMFGEPDPAGRRPSFEAIAERVAWWAELFEIPCVAWAERIEEVDELCAAGADFIALGEAVFSHPNGAAKAVAEVTGRLKLTAPA
jgi:thiamine-phosphate pyrophosphorylase